MTNRHQLRVIGRINKLDDVTIIINQIDDESSSIGYIINDKYYILY